MKKAWIFHNRNAGKQDYTKKKIISLLSSHGFECGYSSTKGDGWKKMDPETDFIVIGGGDGTVRRIAVKLLHKDRSKTRFPIALLPLGTANNIAKSLDIFIEPDEILRSIENNKLKKYDVGHTEGLKKDTIFLEGLGFGIFPELIEKMKENPEREEGTPEENLKAAQELLHDIIEDFPAKEFKITIDGNSHSGKYILVEVMNISSIGPNLNLSLESDPGDGKFEVVLIPEDMRQEFADYISEKIKGNEKTFVPVIIKGQIISITAGPGNLHVDDELMTIKKTREIAINPEPSMMEFFVQ